MYYPYFRGKQYELITIREMAEVMAEAQFRPIIEPVREMLGGLARCLTAISDAGGHAVVVVNPHHGDLSGGGEELTGLLRDDDLDLDGISAGILLKPDTTLAEALKCYKVHAAHAPVLIHAGFTDAKGLAEKLGKQTDENCHVFLDRACGKLYQRHFRQSCRVLVKDGFVRKKRNSEYPLVERFSDLHVIFKEEGMQGFGDFLIVGDDYSESGGPAYAVAIHLTYIDPDQDDAMQIYHFVSTTQDTPKDPAGKFGEALAKMIHVLDKPGSKILETSAVEEFRTLHQQGHFPGLGYVKKLSMIHHIETLADYCSKNH